jgi:hypothetical protein
MSASWKRPSVGWVERSDTQQQDRRDDGYRCAPPILRELAIWKGSNLVHDSRVHTFCVQMQSVNSAPLPDGEGIVKKVFSGLLSMILPRPRFVNRRQ